jgi:hypothetical protein
MDDMMAVEGNQFGIIIMQHYHDGDTNAQNNNT